MVEGFIPNIRCPHCHKAMTVAFTGFGRTGINSRERCCPRCHQVFWVFAYIDTSKEKLGDEDVAILKRRIADLRKQLRRHADRLTLTVKTELEVFRGDQN